MKDCGYPGCLHLAKKGKMFCPSHRGTKIHLYAIPKGGKRRVACGLKVSTSTFGVFRMDKRLVTCKKCLKWLNRKKCAKRGCHLYVHGHNKYCKKHSRK